VLLDPARRPRISPERFDLERFRRFGLLGLVDQHPTRETTDAFEVQLMPLGTDDASDRWARLCELLAGLVTQPEGGEPDATSCPVRAGFDGVAGEGADDPEPACRHHALR
jgi:hypothetical protein